MVPNVVRMLGAVGGAVWLVGCLACTPPPDPEPDADTGQWTPEDADTTEGDTSCSGALSLDLGRVPNSVTGFQSYDDDSAEFELIRGFQGGFHIEPALLLSGVDRDSFTTDLSYEVERTSNGVRVARSNYTIDPNGWEDRARGYVHQSNPVIFDLDRPSAIEGDEVELWVQVDVQSGDCVTAVQIATIVDNEGP